MKKVISPACIALACILLFTSVSADFQAIPSELEGLYHFRLQENFYADDEAFEADLQELEAKIGELENLKGQVTGSAENLYRAYDLSNHITPLWDKLWVYAYLRYAIDTRDTAPFTKIQTTSGDLSSRIQFIRSEVQRMDDETYREYQSQNPGLGKYAFAIEQDLRYRAHTLPLPQEEILSQLAPHLDPWVEELYQKCIDRIDFPELVPVPGETLDVNRNYIRLINDTSRVVRRDTWQGYFRSMNTHRDIYAFALIKKLEANNQRAELRGFDGYPAQSYFDQFLTVEQVASIYDAIDEHAELYKRYQLLRQKAIRAATGYDTVYTWDRSATRQGFEKPRWDIRQASDLIMAALSPLGSEYHDELAGLFDPLNGRLDLVAGENRVSGAFAYGYPGAPWQFYSFAYEGYLDDVSTMAHEAGHAVHYNTLSGGAVEPLYHEGSYYITETVAMLNELLLVDHLYRQTNDLELRTYLLEQLLARGIRFIYLNYLASLEVAFYQRAAKGELTSADDLDALTQEMGSRYSIYCRLHPEYRGMWNVIHHYYTHPMYNLNYVIAGALSLRIFQEIQDDPSFVSDYLKLIRQGFDRPGPEMVRETLGLDISDPEWLRPCFRLIERKLEELKGLYAETGVNLE